jgi:hypothetical protein
VWLRPTPFYLPFYISLLLTANKMLKKLVVSSRNYAGNINFTSHLFSARLKLLLLSEIFGSKNLKHNLNKNWKPNLKIET